MSRSLPSVWNHLLIWLRQTAVMTLKEFVQLGKDRALLLFVLYAFTGNILLAGGNASRELNNANMIVHDADHSAASRDLIYRFQQPYFRFVGEVPDAVEGMRRVEEGQAMLFLDIPEHFAQSLHRGTKTTDVQLLVDTSRATRGYLASSYSVSIGSAFSQDWAGQGAASSGAMLPAIETQTRIRYNPALNEAWFSSIGELLVMMTVMCILLPGTALVREKEHGTIEQLLVSPLTPFQIMFSKVLAMIVVTLAGTALALFGIMAPLFAVPIRGSIGLFFLLTALFAFTTAGLGLLIATFARKAAQVGMLVLFIVMPIVVLSGTFTPRDSMPAALNTIMTLSPLRHFIEVAYGILLRGAGMETLWDSVLAMVVLGSLLFGLGMWRFRRQLE
ncbi:MAG TPA: ABC transporter permease [Chthonomonadaceae bacterium]|nr:ABC transporter permease [Chthonomonadaceae bacterium]